MRERSPRSILVLNTILLQRGEGRGEREQDETEEAGRTLPRFFVVFALRGREGLPYGALCVIG